MKKKRILVVDDEPDFLDMIKMELEADDYKVITACDGKGALDRLKNEKCDAILLDILMPGLDGLQTLKEIRRQDKKMPIFIITAFSNEERFKLAKKSGASGFIVKTGDLKREIEAIAGAIRLSGRYKIKK